jgi:hypothetical protein
MTTETALSFGFPSPIKQTETQREKNEISQGKKVEDINGKRKERKGGKGVDRDKEKRRKKGHRN